MRHLAEAPPGDQEGLGDDIGCILAVLDAPQRVDEDRPRLLTVEAAETGLCKLAAERARPDLTLRHRLYMSGSGQALREPPDRIAGYP
jgi:hypothetical protein